MNFPIKRSIILEGPDGTGKTTLGEHLADTLDIPIFYGGGPPNGDDAIAAACELNVTQTTFPCVQDRVSFISELCYRPVMSPQEVARSSVHVAGYLARALENNPLIVFCMSERGLERATREDYETDEFTMKLRQHMPAIVWRYHQVFSQIAQGYRCLLNYDLTNTTLAEITEQVIDLTTRDYV